jgi:P27 family predicted phage terminase small subunit
MPARHEPLKLARNPARSMVRDARVGGVGLSWFDIPSDVQQNPDALAEWRRLSSQYEKDATRFREGDRAAITAYALAYALYCEAARMLLRDGLTVEGRSSADRRRNVKNPCLAIWTQVSTQLRAWAKECTLTPDSRLRAGLADTRDDDPSGPSAFGRWNSPV